MEYLVLGSDRVAMTAKTGIDEAVERHRARIEKRVAELRGMLVDGLIGGDAHGRPFDINGERLRLEDQLKQLSPEGD